MTDRNALYRKLHAIARAEGLDEDGYRDRLHRITGSRSASALSDEGLEEAAAKFPVKHSAGVSQAHLRKPKALWISCWNLGALERGNDAALDAFVKRQTGKDRLAFLTPPEANAVTEALKDIAKRHGFAVPADDRDGIAARRALVEAQWKLLASWGVVASRDWSMNDYLCRAIFNRPDTTANFKRQDWDKAIRLLGAKIRKAMAQRAKASAA